MANHLKIQSGDKIGLLTVIERAPNKSYTTCWYCNCECGTERCIIATSVLTKKNRKIPCSCGCLQKKQASELGKSGAKDLTNQIFGSLIALEPTEERSAEAIVWKCRCLKCGSIVKVRSTQLKNGHTQSCGCLKSIGELKISLLLNENQIHYEKEKTFPSFSYPNSSGKPRFDFYVENKYIIEYDGMTHFKANGGWNTEKNLISIQYHDKLKNKFCLDNNIPLIRIPYTAYNSLSIEDLKVETSKYLYKGGE